MRATEILKNIGLTKDDIQSLIVTKADVNEDPGAGRPGVAVIGYTTHRYKVFDSMTIAEKYGYDKKCISQAIKNRFIHNGLYWDFV